MHVCHLSDDALFDECANPENARMKMQLKTDPQLPARLPSTRNHLACLGAVQTQRFFAKHIGSCLHRRYRLLRVQVVGRRDHHDIRVRLQSGFEIRIHRSLPKLDPRFRHHIQRRFAACHVEIGPRGEQSDVTPTDGSEADND